jgi:predicted PurR-regulated permease PerM
MAVLRYIVEGFLKDSVDNNFQWFGYLLVAGLADNVLKPLFLGRGVDAPMPVILLGALGGMITAGLVGLFVGAVLLALGYVIFMDWVEAGDIGDSDKLPGDTNDTSDVVSASE